METDLKPGVSAAGSIGVSGPPTGFGGEVNRYLGHYVNVADAKAAACIGGSFAVVALLLSDRFTAQASTGLSRFALFAALVAAGVSLTAVFPRLPKGKQGLLFWEDIRNHGTEEAYVEATRKLSDRDLEAAYARQNFHTSKVLHMKLLLVRWAVVALVIAASAALWIAFRG